jgi:hypothetical protein
VPTKRHFRRTAPAHARALAHGDASASVDRRGGMAQMMCEDRRG